MRVYVGTYAKYNAGNLFGKWLDLENYVDRDEFIEACVELHKDEDDPELMFQDWEDVPNDMISESHISPEVWELIEAFDEHDEDAVKAYVHCFGEWNDEQFRDRYRGEFNSWEEMVEEFLEETGTLEQIPENLRYYFDYEKYARDIRLSGDMIEHDGHFFWNH